MVKDWDAFFSGLIPGLLLVVVVGVASFHVGESRGKSTQSEIDDYLFKGTYTLVPGLEYHRNNLEVICQQDD